MNLLKSTGRWAFGNLAIATALAILAAVALPALAPASHVPAPALQPCDAIGPPGCLGTPQSPCNMGCVRYHSCNSNGGTQCNDAPPPQGCTCQ
jgi:hypothetical protein